MGPKQLWNAHVLPVLVEKACRSHAILEERQRCVPRAMGHVLELGVGSGLNFALYDPTRVIDIVGIDPSRPLLDKARVRIAEARVPLELVECFAERLPFDAGRFDSAVVTYTLCSVESPLRALSEVRRVLRPKGRLAFIEHGAAPDADARKWQRRLTPFWRQLTGNCHLDREVLVSLEKAGFALEEIRQGHTEGSPRWFSFTFEGVAVAP